MTKSHVDEGRSESPGEAFARQLREMRERRGWRQSDLAERLEAIGLPLDQTTISKIEGGVRRVSVDEAFAFALALDVAPVHLLVPRNEGDSVRVAPNVIESAGNVWSWTVGRRPLPSVDRQIYFREVADVARSDPATALALRELAKKATKRGKRHG